MKKKNEKIAILIYILCAIIVGIMGENDSIMRGNEMGFCLIFLFLLLPMLGVIVTVYLSIKRSQLRWGMPILTGCVLLVLPYMFFNNFWWELVVVMVLLSLVSVLIVELVIKIGRKNKTISANKNID